MDEDVQLLQYCRGADYRHYRVSEIKKSRNSTRNAQVRRCSGAVEVSPHKKRLRLFLSQSNNAHAHGEGPQNRGFA